MRKIVRLIMLSLVLMLSVMLTNAQESQSISYDEIVTGELNDETYEQIYTFEAEASDTIFVRMNSTAELNAEVRLDSYVFLRDADGNELAADDDAAGNLNALIGPYTLPQAGTYTIVATRYQQANGTSEGSYELSVTIAEFETIAVGELGHAVLEDTESLVFYRLVAETDGFYQIQYNLISGVGNGDLSIRDEAGNYITSVSVSDSTPSNFVIVRLQANETMIFGLRFYGAYDMNGAPVADPEPLEVEFTIEPIVAETLDIEGNGSVSVSGTLEDLTSIDYYAFSAINGQTIAVTGTAPNGGDFEVYVVLPTGTTAFYGGTYNTESDYIMPPQIITNTGDFLLVVYRSMYSGGEAESPVGYELTLNLSATPELALNVPVEGVVENGSFYDDAYLYRGQAGEAITVTISSLDDNYAPSFGIELSSENMPMDNPAGFYVNFNSSVPGSSLSYDVTLPYDGIYIVRLYNGSYDGSGVGAYRVLLASN